MNSVDHYDHIKALVNHVFANRNADEVVMFELRGAIDKAVEAARQFAVSLHNERENLRKMVDACHTKANAASPIDLHNMKG